MWCHLQGAPHLALDARTLRIYQSDPLPGRRFGFWRLALVGVGAGPQLVTRVTPYQAHPRQLVLIRFAPPRKRTPHVWVGGGLFR